MALTPRQEVIKALSMSETEIRTLDDLNAAIAHIRKMLSVKGCRWVDDAKHGVKVKLLLELRNGQ